MVMQIKLIVVVVVDNLHVSSSSYSQTMEKEFNHSFQQMFMGQERVTNPSQHLHGRLKHQYCSD